MEKVQLSRIDATRLLKSVEEDNTEFDMQKIETFCRAMNMGEWVPDLSRKDPVAITHHNKTLINGKHRLAGFLMSRLQYLNIYVEKNA